MDRALAGAAAWTLREGGTAAERWMAEVEGYWAANPRAFALVKSVLEGVDHGGTAPDPDRAVAGWAATFDRLARTAPEGAVALYALGNPELLRRATDEVVERLAGWGLLPPGTEVLELGCGTGRFLEALAPRVAWVLGLDLSPGMVERARDRCRGLGNVAVDLANGRDLGGLADGAFDLVLAADVFPYLVQAGPEVVDRQVGEAARVLRPGGELVILNLSYRGDLERDRAELAALAARHGLGEPRLSEGDFALWDAPSFRVRRGEHPAEA